MVRRILGVVCVIIGVISILTPFTPGGFLLFVGLELLGLRLLWRRRRQLPKPVPAVPVPEVKRAPASRVVP